MGSLLRMTSEGSGEILSPDNWVEGVDTWAVRLRGETRTAPVCRQATGCKGIAPQVLARSERMGERARARPVFLPFRRLDFDRIARAGLVDLDFGMPTADLVREPVAGLGIAMSEHHRPGGDLTDEVE